MWAGAGASKVLHDITLGVEMRHRVGVAAIIEIEER
jgi:hypothetical protein